MKKYNELKQFVEECVLRNIKDVDILALLNQRFKINMKLAALRKLRLRMGLKKQGSRGQCVALPQEVKNVHL